MNKEKREAIMACSTFEELIDAEYGKKGTAERDQFKNEAEAFCIEECIKTNNVMKFYTHEQMVDKHIGEKGSPERDAFEIRVKKFLEKAEHSYNNITSMTQIKTEEAYNATLRRIEELEKMVDDNTPNNTPEYLELDMLCDLIEEYEAIHYPIGKPSLVDTIKIRNSTSPLM